MSSLTFPKTGATTFFSPFCTLFVIRSSWVFVGAGFGCRSLHFVKPIGGLALQDHVIKEINFTKDMEPHRNCRHQCLLEKSCVSVNVGSSKNDGIRICQLSDSDHTQHSDDLKPRKDFLYWATTNPCSSNPCLHGATCFSGFTDKRYVCVCQASYAGENCEKVSTALPKSCSDLKKLDPNAKIESCLIDPDGEGGLPPFDVICDMSDKDGVGVTVISHDSENRTLVDGYEKQGSYSRDIHYKGANISQLVSLINISQHCEQFIKYECRGSELRDAYWVSRDSVNMTYWSGATPGGHKCACGMNNTCAQPSGSAHRPVYCNCDANDNKWREDSGFLTNNTHLPVKQLRFGDTGTYGYNELGYHILGKFKWYGIA